MKKLLAVFLVAAMAAGLLIGCSSSGSGTTDSEGRTYTHDFDPDTNQVIDFFAIEFQIPESWKEDDGDYGTDRVFNSADGALNVISAEQSGDVPDMSSEEAQEDFISSMDGGDSFVETGRETMTVLGDVTAFYFSCSQNFSGTPVDMYMLVFCINDREYMLGYTDYQEANYNHSQDFDEVIASLTWNPESGEEEEGATTMPENDFFSDEARRAQYDELYKSYQFSALNDSVNSYISEMGDSISSDDSAYTILDLVGPLLEYQDTWTVAQDEFDGSYSITFEGANTISDSESIDPVVKGSDVFVTVGFQKNGWLFFDKFALSINGEEVEDHSVKSYDRDDNVISGETVEESYTANSLFKKVSDQLKDAGTAMIRFENTDNNETYDHTLTDAEKNALYAGYLLRDNYTELSNLIFEFRNDYGIEE